MDRRNMIKKTGAALLGASVLGVDALASDSFMSDEKPSGKKKALVIGAHPDDPESCCGGTMVVLKEAGYEVVSVYMTKGEAGIPDKTHSESAAIRKAEAENACRVLGVRAVFMDQIDGNSLINKDEYAKMKALINDEKPDIVFTHWPIDSHRDHRVCSSLVYDAWRFSDYSFELYYFEAMTGLQSQLFHPTDYVDITKAAAAKREAIFCHTSQKPEDWYDEWHGGMQQFRGYEFFRKGCAEAFVHLRRDTNDIL